MKINHLIMFSPFVTTGGNGGNNSGTHTPFSDSSADTLTVVSQRIKYYDPHELPADDDDTNGFYDSDELESLEHDNECSSSDNNTIRKKRPESLNIKMLSGGHASSGGDTGSTPMTSRKPLYKFSIATTNAYELNNLDSMLDAPTSTYRMDNTDDDNHANDLGHDLSFTSLPCETLLLACKTENDLRKSPLNDTDTCLYVTKFNKNQPLYQSAQVQINHKAQQQQQQHYEHDSSAEKNLLKWKGVTMTQQNEAENDDNDDDKCSIISSQCEQQQQIAGTTLRVSIRNAQKDLHLDEMGIDSNVYRVRLFHFTSISFVSE